jgi:hypothetical protein
MRERGLEFFGRVQGKRARAGGLWPMVPPAAQAAALQ